MFQQLYSYGDTPELATDRNTSPTFEHDFEREFKLVDQKRLSSSSQSPCFSSTLYAVDGTSGSLSGTLPTFTFISHPQSSTQHMQIPAQIETNSQECGVQQQQQQHHQDHNQQQQQQQFEQKLEQSSSDTSALGHHFSTFHSMDSSHDLVANFPVHYPPQMYNPIDISSIVHSPILAELPTTLPPLHHTSLGVMLPHTRPAAPAKEGENENGSSRKKQKTAPKVSRERAPWTPEEDNLLRLAVQLYGDKTEKWAKIAACVPGRTNKNCRKRWFHSLDPSLRKGAWTEEEDQLLREGVMKYPNQWSKIADMLDGRTDDQCAKRWRESLDPSIDRSEWTPEEDKKLMEKYEEYGSQWQKIAQFFEGRPGLHCRNRWRKLQRMNQIKKDKENAAALNRAAAAAPMAFVNGLEQDGRCKQRIREQQLASSSTGDALSSSSPSTIPNVISMLNERDSSSSSSPSSSSSATSILKIVDDDASKLQKRDDEPYSDLNPYGCDIPGCYASFPQSSGLFYHMKSAHPNLEGYPKPYRCAMPNCTKRYKNINGLQYHLREAKGSSGHGLIASKARVT